MLRRVVMKRLVMFGLVILGIAIPPSFVEGQGLGSKTVLPRWADGHGWSTDLVFLNYGHEKTPVVVKFYRVRDDGILPDAIPVEIISYDTEGNAQTQSNHQIIDGSISIGLLKRAEIHTLGLSRELQAGSIEVFGLNSRVTVEERLRYPYGRDRLVTSVFPSEPRPSHTILIDYKKSSFLEQSTGLAIVNHNPNPTRVHLILVDSADRPLNSTPLDVELPPHSDKGLFVHELFGDLLKGRSEFHGLLRVTSDDFTSAMALGFQFQPDGRFLMNSSPAFPGEYRSPGEQIARTVYPICFYPADVPEDPGCAAVLPKRELSAYTWWSMELTRAGYGSLENLVTLPYDSSGKIFVQKMTGQQTAAYYWEDFVNNFGFSYWAEFQNRFPNRFRFVALNKVGQIGQGSRGDAVVPGPISIHDKNIQVEGSWADYVSHSFLCTDIPSTRPVSELTRHASARSVFTVDAHEFGHMLGLPHQITLSEETQGRYLNLMFGSMPGMLLTVPPNHRYGVLKDIHHCGPAKANMAAESNEIKRISAVIPN